jgi:hypothetical protein
LADWLSQLPFYDMLTGAGGQVVTPNGAKQIPVPKVELGVIAGGTGGFGFNPWLGEDNDGVVRVSETRLDAAEADFRLVHSLHAVMAKNRDVVAATLAFLTTGRL